MTNLNREPIGPFPAPARGWDGQEPESPSLPDALMEDDPGIYQDLLDERDEAMQRLERVGIDMRAWKQRAETAEAEVDQLRARNKTLEDRLDQILTLANLE